MSENIHQSLSYLMDNEASDLELRRLLKACRESDDNHLAETWHRYHLVRSVMHKELEQDQLVDIAGRVSQALESEPEPSIMQTDTDAHRYKPESFTAGWRDKLSALADSWAAKGMIAASVAAAVVVLMPVERDAVTLAEQSAPESVYQQSLPARGLQQSPIGVQRVSAGAESSAGYRLVDQQKIRQEQLIQGYLMQHSEYVAASGTHGMMPMARVSGYQTAVQ